MSPSLTSHFAIVPSTTLSPICGMVTSIAISIRREAANRVHYFVGARQNELFKWRTERDVRIERCNSSHRAVEIFERVLGDNRRDFAADSSRQPILVHDQNFAGLARSREDRFAIERQQRAQIEDLDAEPILLFDDSRRIERLAERAAIGDYRKIAAFLANLRDSNRHREIALGKIFLDASIEPLVLEVHDRVSVANRTLQNSFRVVRGRRRDHLQSRNASEPRL